MAKSKKRKGAKPYTPNPVYTNAVANAVKSVQPIEQKSVDSLELVARIALDKMLKGHGDEAAYNDLTLMVDMTLIMSCIKFKRTYIDEIYAAQKAMVRVKKRFQKTGKLGFDGEGLQVIKDVFSHYVQFLGLCTPAEVMNVMRIHAEKMGNGDFYDESQNAFKQQVNGVAA